jgi:hypothetical protein
MLALPGKLFGKTLKFTVSYPGNAVVKKFKKTSKLAIVLPPPPPPAPTTIDPTRGAWTIQQLPAGIGAQQWKFTVNPDATVAKIDLLTTLRVTCPGFPSGFLVDDIPVGPFDTPFTISAVDETWTDEWALGEDHATSTFKVHFDSPSHATGTFRMTGTIFGPLAALVAGTHYPDCDTGLINIELKPGVFA